MGLQCDGTLTLVVQTVPFRHQTCVAIIYIGKSMRKLALDTRDHVVVH